MEEIRLHCLALLVGRFVFNRRTLRAHLRGVIFSSQVNAGMEDI